MSIEEISTGPQRNINFNRKDKGIEKIQIEGEEEKSKVETSREEYLERL